MSSTSASCSSPKNGSKTLVIENISKLAHFADIDFTTNNCYFSFGLFPKEKIKSFENENVYVFLTSHSVQTVHYKVSILDCTRKEKLFTNEYDWTFDVTRGHHIGKFITRSQLLKPENNYLTKDTLTVLCEVELIDQGQNNRKVLTQDLTTLSDNLQCLLTDGKLSDATLVVGKDGKELAVHKNILAARSPVFAAMFEHDCEEKRLGKVTITDMEVDVCQELVRYIYTGKVDRMNRYAMDLLEAADQYQLDSLKFLCVQYLSSNITIENAASVLVHAHVYRVDELKAKCIDFISYNADQVQATEGWKMLNSNSPQLLGELFIHAAKKMKR